MFNSFTFNLNNGVLIINNNISYNEKKYLVGSILASKVYLSCFLTE